jgi:uncharacterized protein YegP (UPF0339 family)
MDRVELYKSEDGYRWRRRAPNGEILSHGEAYTRLHDALVGARRANPDVPVEIPTKEE